MFCMDLYGVWFGCCNLFQHVGFTAHVFLTFKRVFSSMFLVCWSGEKEILILCWCNHEGARVGDRSHIDGLARPNVISSPPSQPHPNPHVIPTPPSIHQRNRFIETV